MNTAPLQLERPLIIFDLETTGTDPATDALFSFAGVKLMPNAMPRSLDRMFKPWKPMSPGATKATGYTDADLSVYPPFLKGADEIAGWMAGCDVGGFNLSNFDIPLLWEELYRCGIKWNLTGLHVVDCGTLFKIREPRDLTAARKFYCGKEHAEAHDAGEDVQATVDVLLGQIMRYPDLSTASVEQLAKASKYEDDRRVDLAGKIALNEDGQPVYNFGKSKGVRVMDDPSFGWWMISKDFAVQTKQILQSILEPEQSEEELF